MSAFRAITITLLSLLFTHVHQVSCISIDPFPVAQPPPKIGGGSDPVGPPPKFPIAPFHNHTEESTTLQWDPNYFFRQEPTDTNDGIISYVIQNTKRTFNITNFDGGRLLLRGSDRKRALCGFKYTYNFDDVSYTIHPRGRKTDHWQMRIHAKDGERDFTYFRDHKHNSGTVKSAKDETYAGDFELSNLPGNAPGSSRITLTNPTRTGIEDYYLMGLWTIVEHRMRRCGA